MRRDSMAVQWEKRAPGFVEKVLERAAENPNPLVLQGVLEFLRWEPSEAEQEMLDTMRRLRGIVP